MKTYLNMLVIKSRQGVTCDNDIEMDKSWMQELTRCSDRYLKGIEEFLRMAHQCVDANGILRCPCSDCSNRYFRNIELAKSHLYQHGIDRIYTRWIFHGEEDPYSVKVIANLHTDTNS